MVADSFGVEKLVDRACHHGSVVTLSSIRHLRAADTTRASRQTGNHALQLPFLDSNQNSSDPECDGGGGMEARNLVTQQDTSVASTRTSEVSTAADVIVLISFSTTLPSTMLADAAPPSLSVVEPSQHHSRARCCARMCTRFDLIVHASLNCLNRLKSSTLDYSYRCSTILSFYGTLLGYGRGVIESPTTLSAMRQLS